MKNYFSKITSSILWDIGAFKISINEPFKLISGNFSPFYINCRVLISNAPAMDIITAFIHWILVSKRIKAEIIAGGETAGIPFASFVAQRLAKPMVYVRKKTKEHGTKSLVEGYVKQGMVALLIEDLITDGKSKVGFVQGLRSAGCQIKDCIVIFDRKQGGKKLLAKEKIELWTLTDIGFALNVGRELDRLSEKDQEEIQEYLYDPQAWHKKRGFSYIEKE